MVSITEWPLEASLEKWTCAFCSFRADLGQLQAVLFLLLSTASLIYPPSNFLGIGRIAEDG